MNKENTKLTHRMLTYNYSLLPNKYLATMEYINTNLRSAIEKTGLTIGYPAWNLLYYSLLCSLPKEGEKIIVETGTNLGFSTIILAQVLKDLNIKGRVYSVDINKNMIKSAEQNIAKANLNEYIHLHVGDSLNFLSWLVSEKTHIDFAFLDSDHEYKQIIKEFSIIHAKIVACKGKVYFDNTSSGGVARALKFIKTKFGGNIIEFKNCSWYPPGNAIWQPD